MEEMTGLKVDEPYLSRILAGKHYPPRVINAIKEILEIEDEDEES